MAAKRPKIPPWWESPFPLPPFDETTHWQASDFKRAIDDAADAYHEDPDFDDVPYTVLLAKYLKYCLDHRKVFPMHYLERLFEIHFIPFLERAAWKRLPQGSRRHRSTLREYYFLGEAVAELENVSFWREGVTPPPPGTILSAEEFERLIEDDYRYLKIERVAETYNTTPKTVERADHAYRLARRHFARIRRIPWARCAALRFLMARRARAYHVRKFGT